MNLRTFTAYALVTVLVLGLALQPAIAAEPAELHIEQPAYIDSDVTIDQDGDQRIYQAAGEELLIRLQNAEHANITGAAVTDGPGSLDYDERMDAYRFETDQSGTSTLRFNVDDGQGVQTYEAVLQVTDVHFVTRTVERDEEMREAAGKWDDVVRETERIDPDGDPEDIVSTGLTFARFIDSPFSTFIQDMQAALIILIMRPGGWAILGTLLAMTLIGVAGGARYRNRTQKQLAEWGDIQVEKDEAYLNKVRKILQQNDWNQLFPDDIARAMREHFGRNVWQGYKQYLLFRSPASVKATVMQMMAQLDYEGRVKRHDDGNIADAWLERVPGEPADDLETDGGDVERVTLSTLRYQDDEDRAFIDAIDPSELDEEVFEMPSDRIDLDQVDFPISNRDVDDSELLERINPDFPNEFKHEEELARCLGEMLEFVIDHPHTDERGLSDRKMDLLSFMSEMDTVLADEADFYAGHLYRRELFWIADNLSADDEIEETMARVSESGVGGDLHGGGGS